MSLARQLTLFDMIDQPSRMVTGREGERLAAALLLRSGYEVVTLHPRSRRGDLLVVDRDTGIVSSIEVKTARLGADSYYRFTLVKTGCTDYHDADYLMLIALPCYGDPAVFLLPSADVRQRSIKMWCHPDKAVRYAKYRVHQMVEIGGLSHGNN